MKTMPKTSGYVYRSTTGKPSARNDDWEAEVYQATGHEEYLGNRRVDDSPVCVFLCPDGHIRAVLAHHCKG